MDVRVRNTDVQGPAALVPLVSAVFVIFLITGAALPALPPHIHDRLAFGTFVAGLVSAAQFAASLVSRLWAGSFSDVRGPKAPSSRSRSARMKGVP